MEQIITGENENDDNYNNNNNNRCEGLKNLVKKVRVSNKQNKRKKDNSKIFFLYHVY